MNEAAFALMLFIPTELAGLIHSFEINIMKLKVAIVYHEEKHEAVQGDSKWEARHSFI